MTLYDWLKKQTRNPANDYVWLMSRKEKILFKKYSARANVYLEFGAGGTTITALKQSGSKVYSVESDNNWLNALRQKHDIIAASETSGRLKLFHADIGSVGNFGKPLVVDNEDARVRFPHYSRRIFEAYPEARTADVVLVDGRFRVACCLAVLLETKGDTIMMIHDYWNRPHYHVIKDFITVIDRGDTLMVCKKSPDAAVHAIQDEYEKHKYDFR